MATILRIERVSNKLELHHEQDMWCLAGEHWMDNKMTLLFAGGLRPLVLACQKHRSRLQLRVVETHRVKLSRGL